MFSPLTDLPKKTSLYFANGASAAGAPGGFLAPEAPVFAPAPDAESLILVILIQ